MRVVVVAGELVPEPLVRRAVEWAAAFDEAAVVAPTEALASMEVNALPGAVTVVWADTPRLGPIHAYGIRADLQAGADVVVGPTLTGGVYALAMRSPRPHLLGPAFARVLEIAAAEGLECGVLRHERRLLRPDDRRALLADPLLAKEVRDALHDGYGPHSDTPSTTAMPDPRSSDRMWVAAPQEGSGVLARLERDGASLRPAFTPVADLRRAAVAGYEVALGFPGEAALTPRAWSLPADPPEAAGDIEARVLRPAIAQRMLLPPGPMLHVTLSHRALFSAPVRQVLASFGRLDDVVLITDAPRRIDEAVALERSLTEARRAGAVLAVETSGGGYEALQLVSRVRAEYVHVDAALVRGLAGDEAKAAALEGLVRLCARAGSYVVAEGASDPEDLAAAMRLGVTLATGPLFGTAEEVPGPLAAAGVAAIRAGAREQLRHTDLHGLIEAVPALPQEAALDVLADTFLADPRHAYLVLLDEEFRPTCLVDRTALLQAEPYERQVTTVSPATTVSDAARRAVGRPSLDRFLPLVCCDAQGRYVGLVRVDGLLEALAEQR